MATVAMFTCDLCAGVVQQMSPPPHDLERLRTTMVDFIVILNRGRSVVSFVRVGNFIPLNGPLNGHSPSCYNVSAMTNTTNQHFVFDFQFQNASRFL